jgi:ankyrin repeat protein
LAALLLQKPTSATASDTREAELSTSPLHQAAERGDVAAVRGLLESGSSVDLVDGRGLTPLHVAVLAGHVDVASLLLDRGADPNSRAALQMTPLHFAAMLGPAEMAGLLARRGARTDARNDSGATPLHLAVDEKVATVLVAAGASLAATDLHGDTPLHTARRSSVARALLDHRADMRIANGRGLTPMQLAAVESLEPAGLSVHSLMFGRLRELIGAMPLSITNISRQPIENLELAARSVACEPEVQPARIARLLPGQMVDTQISFIRMPGVAEGEHPLFVSVSAGGRKLGEVDLRIDTRTTETPEDRGMIRLAKGRIRPAHSRWYYLVYAAAPLLLVAVWLFLRRR